MNTKQLLLYKLIKMLDDNTLASIYKSYLIEHKCEHDASCSIVNERMECVTYDKHYNQYSHDLHRSTACEHLMEVL